MDKSHNIVRPIKLKISILVAIVLTMISIFSLGSSVWFFWCDFQNLEQSNAEQDRDRIRNIFFDQLESLHQFVHDWSSWDETYDFMEEYNGPFIKEYFTKSFFWNSNIDVVIFSTPQGRVIWGRDFNPQSGEFNEIKPALFQFLSHHKPFSKSGKYGLYVDEKDIFLASTRPIFTSSNKGARRGFLTMMRKVDADFMNSFNLEFSTDMIMEVYPKNSLNQAALKKSDGWGQVIEKDRRISFFNITSLNSDYVVSFKIFSQRDITKKAMQAFLWNGTAILIGIALLFLALLFALDKIVVLPLREMADKIIQIGKESNEAIRLDESRSDEIGLISFEVNRMQDRILELALNDHLTGLPNRRLFEDRMSSALERAKRESTQVALLFLDLNGFKQVNDSLGHQTGDDLLVRVARRLKSITRAADSLARLGGDEFGLIMELGPDEDLKTVEVVAEKIVQSLLKPFLIHHQEINISTSIGIAIYPDNTENAEMMIRYADIAMYVSKADDECHWCYFDASMDK